MKKTYYTVVLLALMVILGVYFAPFAIKLQNEDYRFFIVSKFKSLGGFGVLGIITIFALQLALPFLPGEPLEIVSGAVYGSFLGMLYAQIGVLIGSYLVITIIRGLGLRVKKISKLKWLRDLLDDEKRLTLSIFFITLIPGFPKDVIPFFVSQTIIGKWKYLLVNFIARIPSILSSTLIGSSIINGNLKLSVLIFAIEGLFAILGLIFNKKIVDLFKTWHKRRFSTNNKFERNDNMSQIKCNAQNCGYNENNMCHKKNIKVEGLFSRSKLGTFCQSFRNPIDEALFKEEMADEMNDEEHKTKIGCSANYCIYNKDNYCKAEKITVGQKNAKYRSETQCDSFELK